MELFNRFKRFLRRPESKIESPKETLLNSDPEVARAELDRLGVDVTAHLGKYGSMQGHKFAGGMLANANVYSESLGKVWFGDVFMPVDGKKLQALADEINSPVHVLEEFPARFKPPKTISELKELAVHSFEPKTKQNK